MGQSTILIIGLVVFALLVVGVFLTILEFRKMGQHPEDYVEPEEREDVNEKKYENAIK